METNEYRIKEYFLYRIGFYNVKLANERLEGLNSLLSEAKDAVKKGKFWGKKMPQNEENIMKNTVQRIYSLL